MHRLSASFVLGYHGCDYRTAEKLLKGELFLPSNNEYDWLGPGIYFWEANPERALEFAVETGQRDGRKIRRPAVVGAVIDLGHCLDLATSAGIQVLRRAYVDLRTLADSTNLELPANSGDQLRRNLDCAVVRQLHSVRAAGILPPADTVRGVFTEGPPAFPGSGFPEKTHIQIAVCNPACIKGVFRVRAGR